MEKCVKRVTKLFQSYDKNACNGFETSLYQLVNTSETAA